MKVLSLFDGISCGQLALQRAGIPIEVYYASEIEPNAIKITQKNFPNTIQLGDVTKIDFKQFECEIDLIIGGSPCQDLSIAGKRKGLQGDRSGLFYKFVEAIEVIKPKYFLLENNYGMPPEAYEEMSRLMGCYPIMINSALVSAQNRKRFYWFNWGKKKHDLFGFPTCDIPLPQDKGILLKDILDSGVPYQEKSYCLTTRYGGATFPHDYRGRKSMIAESMLYQLPHGYNNGGIKKNKSPSITKSSWENNNLLITKLEDMKNIVNPNADYMNELAKKNDGEIPVMWDSYNKNKLKNKSPTLNTKSNTSYNNAGGTNIMHPVRLRKYEKSAGQAQRVYSVRGKTICINANGGGQGGKTGLYKIDLPDGDYIIRKLSPIECERLQTLPDNYTAGISNNQRYKAIGNGWTVDVIAHIFKQLKAAD